MGYKKVAYGTLKKQTNKAFGKTIYLLGKDKNGVNYWLEKASWDCDWYWGFGYVETYTNNNKPQLSRDINSHQHIDSLFLRGNKCAYDLFLDFFAETTLDKNEIWQFLDYMYSFYTLRETAELFGRGYSHFTERAKIENLKNETIVNKINKELLPELFNKIETLLTTEMGA